MRHAMNSLIGGATLAAAIVLIFGGLTLHSSPAHAEVSDYAKIGWWSITYGTAESSNGCAATAQFQDQTIIQLALVQSDNGKGWLVSLSNPKWNTWISKKSQHTLWLVTTSAWQGTFTVSDDKTTLILENAAINFVNNVADARSLMIFNDGKQSLNASPLNLKDSEAAIKAVVNCVREHPRNSAPAPEAETTTTGTAFFVAPNHLLTNNHVVKECRSPIHVRYPERAWYTATLSGQDDANDLALLYTDMPNRSVASFRVRSRVGEPVAAYGFPYSDLLSSSGNFTLGNVTALTGLQDDTRFLQMSTPIQPGNSGGPLLDMSGHVVGVVVRTLNALAMMQMGKSVPQNVNFAIQVPIVINFLSIKGMAPVVDSSRSVQALPPSDVADMAKQFTVQVFCQGIAPRTSGTIGAPISVLPGVMEVVNSFRASSPLEIGRLLRRANVSEARRLLNTVGNMRKITMPRQ